MLVKTQRLMESYLRNGALGGDERLQTQELLQSSLFHSLPDRPGGVLQRNLFLVRRAVEVLGFLCHDRLGDALDRLVHSLLEAEGRDRADDSAIADPGPHVLSDPFDGLLYLLGAHLAKEAEDHAVENALRSRAKLMAENLRSRSNNLEELLESGLKSDSA